MTSTTTTAAAPVTNENKSHDPSSLLFYLNHPIQFVCVTGVVVAFDDYERLWVFTIDATCRKPEKVKVKGTISTFRSVRQIALECIEIIPDTNSELRFRTQCTQLFADVLSKP